MIIQIDNQHNQISNFMHESEVLRNKHEHSMRFIKEDILSNVPVLIRSMLDHKTEEDDQKLKRSVLQLEEMRAK